MKIRRGEAKNRTSNWTIWPSERDMEAWGKKFGYAAEMTYNVDLSMPLEGTHEGFVALWKADTDTAQKNRLVYQSTVIPQGEAFVVEYKVIKAVINEEDRPYTIPPVYVYPASRKEACRTTKRSFIKDLLRDGHLALWPDRDEFIAKFEQEQEEREAQVKAQAEAEKAAKEAEKAAKKAQREAEKNAEGQPEESADVAESQPEEEDIPVTLPPQDESVAEAVPSGVEDEDAEGDVE